MPGFPSLYLQRGIFTENTLRQIDPAAILARQVGKADTASRRNFGRDTGLRRNERLFRAR